MLDAIAAHLDERPPPALHYGRNDPKLLGETLVMAAQLSFNVGNREATYDCNGQWFRYKAGGSPFQVAVTIFADNGEQHFFTVDHTGDGLTFRFETQYSLPPIAQLVMHAAREQAAKMRHSV